MKNIKYIMPVALLLIVAIFITGCTPWQLFSNNVSLCTVVNCESVGIVDIAGPHNPLIPDQPDYDLDPTCSLPGFCGPNPWFPFAQ